jgi:hypothetical protein
MWWPRRSQCLEGTLISPSFTSSRSFVLTSILSYPPPADSLPPLSSLLPQARWIDWCFFRYHSHFPCRRVRLFPFLSSPFLSISSPFPFKGSFVFHHTHMLITFTLSCMYLYDKWALYRNPATRTGKNTLGVYWVIWMIAIGVRPALSLLTSSRLLPHADSPKLPTDFPCRWRLLWFRSRNHGRIRGSRRTPLLLCGQLKQHVEQGSFVSHTHSFPPRVLLRVSFFPLSSLLRSLSVPAVSISVTLSYFVVLSCLRNAAGEARKQKS